MLEFPGCLQRWNFWASSEVMKQMKLVLCCSPAFACFLLRLCVAFKTPLSFLSFILNQSFLSTHSDDLTPRTFPSGSMSNTLSKLFSLYFRDLSSLFCYTLLYFAICATLFHLFHHRSLGPVWFKNLAAILCHYSGWQSRFPANVWSVFCQLVRQPQRVLCLQWSARSA